jgi:hypothetical protein
MIKVIGVLKMMNGVVSNLLVKCTFELYFFLLTKKNIVKFIISIVKKKKKKKEIRIKILNKNKVKKPKQNKTKQNLNKNKKSKTKKNFFCYKDVQY